MMRLVSPGASDTLRLLLLMVVLAVPIVGGAMLLALAGCQLQQVHRHPCPGCGALLICATRSCARTTAASPCLTCFYKGVRV